MSAKATCDVQGCNGNRLARGWCAKHYSRWQTYGDPMVISSKLRGEPGLPAIEQRWIGNKLVFFTEDGRAFVTTRRRNRAGEWTDSRYYGIVFECQECHRECFTKRSGVTRHEFCGHDCAGVGSGRRKVGRRIGKTKPTATNEKNYLDRLLSVLVRDAGACVECGSTENLQCAHGFSRRYLSVRWDRRNVFCLCQRCHLRYTHRPLEWDEWLRERWGEDLYSELRGLALRVDIKVDRDVVRQELADQIRAARITVSRFPKSAWGWAGLAGEGVTE